MMDDGITYDDLEAEIEEMAEGLLDALVRKAQDQRVNTDQPKNKCSDVGSAVDCLVAMMSFQPLDKYERMELEALTYYVAREKESNEGVITNMILQKFRLDRIDDIPRRDFKVVLRYLQDMIVELSEI